MSQTLTKLLSTLLSLSLLLNFPCKTTSQECPYPCYPPPTGTTTGNNPTPPYTTLAPPSTTLAPPTQASFYPPPTGYLPFSPPFMGASPPPPDAMVSWFPYYFHKPPHDQSDQSSSSTGLKRSTVMIVLTQLFLLYCFLLRI